MTRFVLFALALAVVPSSALAQARVLEDKKAEKYNEIERGFFFEVNGGFFGVLNPPASSGKTYPSFGEGMAVSMGLDIGDRISVAVMLLASANKMGSDYTGFSTNAKPASGDFSAMVPGAAITVRFADFKDSQDVSRVWIYGRGRVGYVLYSPTALLPNPDVFVSGALGVEYFTHLRHFSIGLEGSFNFYALSAAMGFSVFPTVRYAF